MSNQLVLINCLVYTIRFFLLFFKEGQEKKKHQKNMYSESTLLGQRNQLVHLCFSDGDEKHLDRIPRENQSVWKFLSQWRRLDLDMPGMWLTQNCVE